MTAIVKGFGCRAISNVAASRGRRPKPSKEGARFTQHDWTIVAEISLADRDHPPVLTQAAIDTRRAHLPSFPVAILDTGSETKRSQS
jgi:hypothetical protein